MKRRRRRCILPPHPFWGGVICVEHGTECLTPCEIIILGDKMFP